MTDRSILDRQAETTPSRAPASSQTTFPLRDTVRPLKQSVTLAINELVRRQPAEERLLHMGFGQSPFPVHSRIREAMAANADKNMYLPSAGEPELRTVATQYFAKRCGFDAEGFDAIVGPGSKELLFDVQLAVEGDLLMPVPSWVSYGPQATLLDDRVLKIATTVADHYHVTGDRLEWAIKEARHAGRNPTKLIINYPNNPSGLSLTAERLQELADVCSRHNILVISDEIYGLVAHKQRHQSIARFYPDGTIVTSGLSKHLSLGGYRLGVALVPKALHHISHALVRIASETWSAVAAPMQFAAITAFEGHADIESYIKKCTEIHRLIAGHVRDTVVSLGVTYPLLDGAFYLYPDWNRYREALATKRRVSTSDELAEDLIDDAQLATLPGTAFGADPSELTLRLATCDFDGRRALAFHDERPEATSQSFVAGSCPNIAAACEALRTYFEAMAVDRGGASSTMSRTS